YDVAQGLQGQINAAVTQTRTVANRAYGGIAAVASFQPITIGDPGKFVWAIGTGGYRDKIGVSAQIGYRFVSTRAMISAGIAAHNGDWKSPVWRAGLQGEF
ncbi:MAG: YadA-like family protein, partial [Caldilineaceae bacterium]